VGHIHCIGNNILKICFENKGKFAIPNKFFLTPLVLNLSFMILKKETPTSYKIYFDTYFANKRGSLC
jgi:hypothetical protein